MIEDPRPPMEITPWASDDVADLVRRRQRGRALVTGLLLGGLVLLIFFITIAKIKAGMK